MARQIDVETILDLAATSSERFTTVRATIRDWSDYGRISFLQELSADPQSRSAERVTQIWVDADRRVRERLDSGQVRHGQSLDQLSNWPLLDASWLIHDRPRIVEEQIVAGRSGIAVEVDESAHEVLLPGSDRAVAVVDLERGTLLRCEAWFADELLLVEEMVEIVFDEPLDPSLFESAQA